MSYTGKYALAKHETLALKCEELERQLELAEVNERDLNDIIQALDDELTERERQLEEANSMTEHYRNLWLEICISHNELNSKLQEQLKEK